VAARRDFPVMVLFWGNLDAGAALIDRHPDTASSSTTLASFSRACRTRRRSPLYKGQKSKILNKLSASRRLAVAGGKSQIR
jgi:hypothetical protein